jgi:hypothetical protein
VASSLKVETIKSLAGNEAMTISESGISTFSTPIIQSYPFVSVIFDTQTSSSNTLMSVETIEPGADRYSWWDAANSWILPTMPGWYEVYMEVLGTGTNISLVVARIYKNGSQYANNQNRNGTPNVSLGVSVMRMMYFNGVSDYVQANAGVYGTSQQHTGFISVKLLERDSV